jgi:hypothetical protein
LAACCLLCLGAPGAGGADEAAPAETAVPALPPPVELVAPSGTVEWTWIVPATDSDAGGEGNGAGEGQGEGERLTDKPPQGVAPLRLGTIRFLYQGEEPAPALRIVGTIPDDLEYVDGSATGPGAEVEYDAAARQLSWTIAGPLDPGTRGLVSFRAVPAGASDPEAVEAP